MKTENPVILSALALELGATPADVARFTVSGVPFTTVRVSARRG